jgi:N4-gp56 family major capsid protein
MAMTTTSDVAYFLPEFYDKTFLEVFQPIPKAADYCMQKALPLHQGKTVYFPKMTATSDNPGSYIMTEGTPITPETFVDEQVIATVVPFGNAKGISDFAEMTAIDSTTVEVVKNLAVQANNLLDKQILAAAYNSGATGYTVYKATATSVSASVSLGTSYGGFPVIVANADFAGSASTVQTDLSATTTGLVSAINSCGGVDSVISAATLRRAAGKLKGKNVTPLEKGYYAFLCHTDIAMTLLADSSITDLYKYTDPENLKKGIVGMYANTLIVEDNNILVAPTAGLSSGAVYFNILLGRGALAVTKLDGGVKTYTKPAGSAGTADPINQNATFGWKAIQAATITNTSGGLIVIARA